MADFIRKHRNISHHLTQEEVLSGRGIESIYLFLRSIGKCKNTDFTEEIEKARDKSILISKFKNVDDTCKKTFEFFTRFYARCAKNLVLDSMATGGIYIAGGIAAKNSNIFSQPLFLKEFNNAYRRNKILEKTPIYVIRNYDVSLLGACFAAVHHFIG